ncbi:type II toxin-antitoxin system VapC family toxin [Thermus thalpophilus]|uniref:type II toxin-antitoxin system VapC family toxin n=1 Tax=Thermus thalpophilus TaxID=2908147 RepID=UPI001FA9D8AA
MRFWDTSAIVPLLVQETSSTWAQKLLAEDREMLVFWLAEIEALSALNRRRREGALDEAGFALAQKRLQRLKDAWHEVKPTERIRKEAIRLLQTHPLRTLDALQLAALCVVAKNLPTPLPLVALDVRLAQAAAQEGFPVLQRV